MEKPQLTTSNLRKIYVALSIAKIESEDDFFDEEIKLTNELLAHVFCEEHNLVADNAEKAIEYMMADDVVRQASVDMISRHQVLFDSRKNLMRAFEEIKSK